MTRHPMGPAAHRPRGLSVHELVSDGEIRVQTRGETEDGRHAAHARGHENDRAGQLSANGRGARGRVLAAVDTQVDPRREERAREDRRSWNHETKSIRRGYRSCTGRSVSCPKHAFPMNQETRTSGADCDENTRARVNEDPRIERRRASRSLQVAGYRHQGTGCCCPESRRGRPDLELHTRDKTICRRLSQVSPFSSHARATAGVAGSRR